MTATPATTLRPGPALYEPTCWGPPLARWSDFTTAVVQLGEGVSRLHLIGGLDRSTASALLSGARGCLPPQETATLPGIVLLDLSALTFVDDAGMAALVTVQDDLRRLGCTVRSVLPHGPVLHLLDHAARAGWCPPDLQCTDILQWHRR